MQQAKTETNKQTKAQAEKKKTIELVQALSSAFGPSGMEDEVRDEICTRLQAHTKPRYTFSCDSIGNLYVENACNSKVWITLDAHMDEVGFMIQNVLADGTLSFLPLGGWDPVNAAGQAVTIHTVYGGRIRGVVTSIPPHFQNGQEKKQPDFSSLRIDIGADSRDQVFEAGVEPGCFVVPQTECTFDWQFNTFCGKAFDDRIGCAALMMTLEQLKDQELSHVEAIFTAQEEVGERGMMAAVEALKGKLAICFEGCPADDTFGEVFPTSAMGKGPMIRAFDKSMITHPKWLGFARLIAHKNDLPLQIAVRKGGGTNGGILHTHNIPTIVIGIPTRYAHSSCCFCSIEDLNNAVKLACKIIEGVVEIAQSAQDSFAPIFEPKEEWLIEYLFGSNPDRNLNFEGDRPFDPDDELPF